jgi:hypothetical protein
VQNAWRREQANRCYVEILPFGILKNLSHAQSPDLRDAEILGINSRMTGTAARFGASE